MTRKLVRSNLSRNRVVSASMVAFLALASALLASALILGLAVVGTVDGFMESARTPHFMQMHQGPVNEERLASFAASRPEVVAFEVIDYLNVQNAQLRFGQTSLEAEVQQNGFVTQPRHMDRLLRLDGEVARPMPGEIYVPTPYVTKYGLEPGNEVSLHAGGEVLTFVVAGAFRDSQMNSSLASSKRLLLHESDYATAAKLLGTEPERLISFRLQDPSAVPAFEAAYFAAGLEASGPTLTWALFRLVNGLNDGLTVLFFVLMSGVVLLIAFLCIRYALTTTLEEDLRNIGVMKALGVSNTNIGATYLGKYRLLLAAGAALGGGAALLARGAILAGVQRQMGEVGLPMLGVMAAVVGVLVLYALAMLYVRRVLAYLRSITPLHALRGSGLSARRYRPRPALGGRTGGAVIGRLAWASVRFSPGSHVTVLLVALLATVAFLVPIRFGATARSAEFVTYMGIGAYDLRVDLLGVPDAATIAAAAVDRLAADDRVLRVEAYHHVMVSALSVAGDMAPLRIDYGAHDAFPLRYGAGRAPASSTEIALSEINAASLGVDVGDALLVHTTDGLVTMTITGTYQDITNGGKTAKALPGSTSAGDSVGVMIAIAAAPNTDLAQLAASISAAHPALQVLDTSTYVSQVMGDMLRVMDALAWLFAGLAVVLATLVAGMAVRLMQVRERRANAVLRALGFTTTDLRRQYGLRVVLAVVVGVMAGALLATPVGNVIGDLVFSTVGVSGLSLEFVPLATLLGAAAVAASAAASVAGATGAGAHGDLAARLRA